MLPMTRILGVRLLRLQDLDETATDTMTPRAWLNLQKKFKRSYMLTSALGYDSDVTDLQLARLSGTNVMLTALMERDNSTLSGFGGRFSVMNQLSQGTRLGWHDYLQDRIIEKRTGQTDKYHNASNFLRQA